MGFKTGIRRPVLRPNDGFSTLKFVRKKLDLGTWPGTYDMNFVYFRFFKLNITYHFSDYIITTCPKIARAATGFL